MTDTTTTTPALDFDSLLDAAGTVLAAKLTDCIYVDGYEAGQTKELIAALADTGRTALLAHLVYNRL